VQKNSCFLSNDTLNEENINFPPSTSPQYLADECPCRVCGRPGLDVLLASETRWPILRIRPDAIFHAKVSFDQKADVTELSA
jgi:hypothetical protein